MTRPIKFRARALTLDKRWVYGSYIFNPEDGSHVIFDWENLVEVAVDGDTVGQFTGLHDKNGKEIYEGDIFKGTLGSIYRVVFDEFNAGFGVVDVKRGNLEFPLGKIEKLEVIGNIYENEDLLK